MQPSRRMRMADYDHMMELNRLYLKTPENVHTPNISCLSSFNQPTPNYSSSSTDSYSPESFPALSYRTDIFKASVTHTPLSETLSETPFALARRPIVGRKILGISEAKQEQKPSSFEERLNIDQRSCDSNFSPSKHWHNPQTPPKKLEQHFYQLFPENRGFELKTPVNTPVKTPSIHSNISPSSSISPTQYNPFSMGGNPPMSFRTSSPISLGASSRYQDGGQSSSRYQDGGQKMCTFCRKNGETPLVYMTHVVKEKRGNRNIVTCPILRSHVCSTCGVSGDNAHTITYCPVLRSSNNGMPLKSTTITLKNTRIKSNGRRRY